MGRIEETPSDGDHASGGLPVSRNLQDSVEAMFATHTAKQEGLTKASEGQVGGSHYKSMLIQPVEFITKNNIGFVEGCVIKYVCRHEFKNGVEDIDKAIHFLELLKELKYS